MDWTHGGCIKALFLVNYVIKYFIVFYFIYYITKCYWYPLLILLIHVCCGLGFMLFFPVSYCIMIYAYFILI